MKIHPKGRSGRGWETPIRKGATGIPSIPPGEVSPINEFFTTLSTDVRDEAGQTMAEYAVVLGVITIAVVVTLGLLSTAIKNTLNNVISSL
jgi:Flp pilus assembly pilin Flp